MGGRSATSRTRIRDVTNSGLTPIPQRPTHRHRTTAPFAPSGPDLGRLASERQPFDVALDGPPAPGEGSSALNFEAFASWWIWAEARACSDRLCKWSWPDSES